MPESSERFDKAIALADAANSEDPNRETFAGREEPKELLYARRMSHWLERLAPEASEALRLAARYQHIRRWTIPRDRYPRDRPGYLRWRRALYDFHAETAAGLLTEAGYDRGTIDKVQSLLRKKNLKTDPDMATLEDTACLVFLEGRFADFLKDYSEEKLVGIVRKVWGKMSARGREAALKLALPPEARSLIEKALKE